MTACALGDAPYPHVRCGKEGEGGSFTEEAVLNGRQGRCAEADVRSQFQEREE